MEIYEEVPLEQRVRQGTRLVPLLALTIPPMKGLPKDLSPFVLLMQHLYTLHLSYRPCFSSRRCAKVLQAGTRHRPKWRMALFLLQRPAKVCY